jgi:hypothetical protein
MRVELVQRLYSRGLDRVPEVHNAEHGGEVNWGFDADAGALKKATFASAARAFAGASPAHPQRNLQQANNWRNARHEQDEAQPERAGGAVERVPDRLPSGASMMRQPPGGYAHGATSLQRGSCSIGGSRRERGPLPCLVMALAVLDSTVCCAFCKGLSDTLAGAGARASPFGWRCH